MVGGAGKFSLDTGGGAMFLGKEVKGASRGAGVVSSLVGGGGEGRGSSTGTNFPLSSSIFDFRCFPSRARGAGGGVVASSTVVGGTSLKNGSSTSCRADALRAEWKFSMSLMNWETSLKNVLNSLSWVSTTSSWKGFRVLSGSMKAGMSGMTGCW